MTQDDRALIDWATSSLINYPEEWTRNEYRVVHRTGVGVWIANGPGALRIVGDDNFSEGPGGISMWGRLIPWRLHLWRAAMAIPISADAAATKARHRIRALLSGTP